MDPWDEVAREQAGALARAQALSHGLSSARWDRNIQRGLWQPVHPGVVAAFSGPVPELTRVWAALLHAGPGAVASHGSAASLEGWLAPPPRDVHVLVPNTRHPETRPGVTIHRTRDLRRLDAPVRRPPRTRVEDTVLDLVDAAPSAAAVVDVVPRACQHRRTTAARLVAAAAQRPRLRWRRLFLELVEDVVDGALTPLERHWRRDVEIAHGLPRGQRNRPEVLDGRLLLRDVRYRPWPLVVELDGRIAHPPENGSADRARDRALLLAEETRTLRYGWPETLGTPCLCAAELARGLWRVGWPDQPHACGPSCPVRAAAAA